MNKAQIFFTLVITALMFSYCGGFYKAGSRVRQVDVTITSNIKHKIFFDYISSRDSTGLFTILPIKYSFLKNGGDLEYSPDYNKIVYINLFPSEAYVFSSNGVFLLSNVFIPSIDSIDFLYDKNKLKIEDRKRIENRFSILLKESVNYSKNRNIPDSLVFYDSISKDTSFKFNW